jgi:hypothetical protein
MRTHPGGARSDRSNKPLLTTASAVALAVTLLLCVMAASLRAQSAPGQAPAARPPTPQWQIDAGGKMEFDVASVKQNTAPQSATIVNSNIPLGPQDVFSPTGGLPSATDFPLFQYMILGQTRCHDDQLNALRSIE